MHPPLPSVLLHDHLDGGLRPSTVIDLARSAGHTLPATDPHLLGRWFDQGRSGSLETYLMAFEHTVAVMQTQDALSRVAREAVEDLAADGVVYAELRFAPMLHTRRGLPPERVIEAVAAGCREAGARLGLRWGLIVDAIRSDTDSLRAARAAVRMMGQGVVGFDLAGPEAGHPPEHHLPALRLARESGLRLTLHAGEAGGVASLASALHLGAAQRIGHGIEIVDDSTIRGSHREWGSVAREVRDRGIPLEICPTSNLHTKGWRIEDHPFGLLMREGFAVTVNTDNRLMSNTSMSQEYSALEKYHGLTIEDRARSVRTALAAAFTSAQVKKDLWDRNIAPPFRSAGAEVTDWTRPSP